MSDAYRTAYVYVRDDFAGTLRETEEGYAFEYDDAYLAQKDATNISVTLPLSGNPYLSKVLFPFFDGLIPEGWLLDIVVSNWKLDKNDRFGLLLVACRDCIGNVSIKEVRS